MTNREIQRENLIEVLSLAHLSCKVGENVVVHRYYDGFDDHVKDDCWCDPLCYPWNVELDFAEIERAIYPEIREHRTAH